tara:strand:- start:18 stop:158 length:141 start_codon:yes stop_codon:yes gene_type:complete
MMQTEMENMDLQELAVVVVLAQVDATLVEEVMEDLVSFSSHIPLDK